MSSASREVFRPGVPVTAWAVCNALGHDERAVAAALSEGRSGLGKSPIELAFETRVGAVRAPLDAPPPSKKQWDSRQARLTLHLLEQIAAPVRAAVARWGADRVAVVLATSVGGLASTEDVLLGRRGGPLPEHYDFERQHAFAAFAELTKYVLAARGPCYVISTACSSSGKVFSSARRLMAAGLADAVVVGGVDSLARTTLCGFKGLSVLSPGFCRPFGHERDGINIGEGGAILLLERTGEARGRVLGVGESADAFHMSSPHPEGLGARMAMEAALAEAGVDAGAVDHVNAHGTGTKRNDAAEAKAIAALFGTRVPVTSTKGYTGHMLGAAGATEAVFSLLAIEQGWIPASLGAQPLDPQVGISVNTSRRDLACRKVLSNSFGFGGNNVAVLFGGAAS